MFDACTGDSADTRGESADGDDDLRRPALTAQLSGAQLRRWYWLRSELADLARELDVSSAGGKAELTDRLAAALDGRPLPAARGRQAPVTAGQLDGDLSADTVIPARQRSVEVPA